MNNLHNKYLEGEIVYAAKIDSVSVAPGCDRAQLEILIMAQRIDKLIIRWENNEKSKDLSIGNKTGVFYTTIDNLPEGEYLFNIISYDAYNNKSLEFEFQVVTYGDNYRSALLNRRIESMKVENSDEVKIRWRTPNEGAQETKFSYTTAKGIVSVITIPASTNETVISDFKPGGSYTFSTFYLPKANAVDTFETDQTSGLFPELPPEESDG